MCGRIGFDITPGQLAERFPWLRIPDDLPPRYNVAPTQTLPVNVTMGLAGLTEVVEVRAATAEVLTQTAQVATNFSQELIAMLPTNRDINSVLLMAPAVHPAGPGGNFSIAGDVV